MIAFAIGLMTVALILPLFNETTDKHMEMPFSSPPSGFTCFVSDNNGLVSGSYPALYLSSFKPAGVLKGSPNLGATHLVAQGAGGISIFTFSHPHRRHYRSIQTG